MPRTGCAYPLNGAVVVAVATMRVMQVPTDEIVRVVTVRDSLMSTIRAMRVIISVAFTTVAGRACVGIGVRHRQGMLIVMTSMLMVKVPVMQVVGVVTVLDRGMTTVRPMLVVVISVFVMVRHGDWNLVRQLGRRCTSQA